MALGPFSPVPNGAWSSGIVGDKRIGNCDIGVKQNISVINEMKRGFELSPFKS